MSWKDLRRYWRRVYGFLLPEKAEPCVLVEFYRGPYLESRDILNSNLGRALQYPLSTILSEKPRARSIDCMKKADLICSAIIGEITKPKTSLFSAKPALKIEKQKPNKIAGFGLAQMRNQIST